MYREIHDACQNGTFPHVDEDGSDLCYVPGETDDCCGDSLVEGFRVMKTDSAYLYVAFHKFTNLPKFICIHSGWRARQADYVREKIEHYVNDETFHVAAYTEYDLNEETLQEWFASINTPCDQNETKVVTPDLEMHITDAKMAGTDVKTDVKMTTTNVTTNINTDAKMATVDVKTNVKTDANMAGTDVTTNVEMAYTNVKTNVKTEICQLKDEIRNLTMRLERLERLEKEITLSK